MEHVKDSFEGRRRWPSSAAQKVDGGRFYTFKEWVEYCGDEEDAKKRWRRCMTEADELDCWNQMKQAMKNNVDRLDPVRLEHLQELHQGKVILQDLSTGCSLRAGNDGELERYGGAGARAQFDLDIQRITQAYGNTEYDVRLRCCHGTYLQDNGGTWKFSGTLEPLESTGLNFKMLVIEALDTEATIIALFDKNRSFLGSFALKWAWDPLWTWRQWWLAKAQIVVQSDTLFSGKRCDPNDFSSCFSFQDLMQYIHERGWGGPYDEGVIVLAKHAWLNWAVLPESNDWLQVESSASVCMIVDEEE